MGEDDGLFTPCMTDTDRIEVVKHRKPGISYNFTCVPNLQSLALISLVHLPFRVCSH